MCQVDVERLLERSPQSCVHVRRDALMHSVDNVIVRGECEQESEMPERHVTQCSVDILVQKRANIENCDRIFGKNFAK